MDYSGKGIWNAAAMTRNALVMMPHPERRREETAAAGRAVSQPILAPAPPVPAR